jgi:hypothetical protein
MCCELRAIAPLSLHRTKLTGFSRYTFAGADGSLKTHSHENQGHSLVLRTELNSVANLPGPIVRTTVKSGEIAVLATPSHLIPDPPSLVIQ